MKIKIYIYIGAIDNEKNQQNVDVFTMANMQNYILTQRVENTVVKKKKKNREQPERLDEVFS